MTRCLVSIGVALIDAGARPDITAWTLNLLGATQRAYLPRPEVEVNQRHTILRFHMANRELILAVARPGLASWCRTHPDGTQDHAAISLAPVPCMQRLFDWLLDDVPVRA